MSTNVQRWWEGRVTIVVQGHEAEKLLGTMMQQHICLWSIVRMTADRVIVTLSLRDIWRLRALVFRSGCRVRFLQKSGFPFVYQRLLQRKVFLCGAVLFVAALYMLSSVVWTIRIVGNETVPLSHVLRVASSMGLYTGQWKKHLPPWDQLSARMLVALPQFAWIGIELQGTKATIRVVEAKIPLVMERTSPQHLIAKTDAIVSKIIAHQGVPVVRVHQHVSRGDILIKGQLALPSPAAGQPPAPLVVASGEVRGKTWLTYTVQSPLLRTIVTYTGNVATHHSLAWGNRRLIWRTPAPSSFVQASPDIEHIPIRMGTFTLPVYIQRTTMRETTKIQKEYTIEQAKAHALDQIRAQILAIYGADVRFLTPLILHTHIYNGKVKMKVVYAVEIALGVPLPITESSRDTP